MPVGLKHSIDGDRTSGTLRCNTVKANEWGANCDEPDPTDRGWSSLCTPTHAPRERTASVDTEDALEHAAARPRFALGWLDGIPLPAALVTPTGEIAAASPALVKLTDNDGAMVGLSLLTLLWPDSRNAAAHLIAYPNNHPDTDDGAVVVMLNATGTQYALRVGMPLGSGRSAMRLALLQPLSNDDVTMPRPRQSSGSIPAPPHRTEGPLQALGGLPLTALVAADGRVVAVTQRAASLLGIPAQAFESVALEDLFGRSAAADLFPEATNDGMKWQPQALPAIPIRVDGAIRASACCVVPFGRPGVGLILIESWGGNSIEIPSEHARQSSAGYLIAGVAHEINNPLAFIIPALTELQNDLATRRDSMRGHPVDGWLSQLEEIVEGITRIAAVVQNLRVARESTPETEPTLVNQVAANTLRLAAASVPPQISIRRDLGLVLPACANRQRLGQVLLNLVLNAAHALEDSQRADGTIFVRSWSDANHTWLEVRDDGPGVPAEHRERIFEPFFTTRAKGSGLGLAVCRAMIRELGGELTLEAEATPGACFRIRLPLWQAKTGGVETQSTVLAASAVAPQTLPRRRVLLVDDDPPVRRALRRMLATHHHVEEAGSLQEAFEKAQLNSYDVLLTDLVMSHGGGPALIERLKQAELPLAERVIIISGMAPDATPLKYPRVTKPCTSEDLLDAIERVVR
jgi:signal transduction histidine kinase